MPRMVATLTALLVSSATAVADRRLAGTKGTVTAWDETGTTVIETQPCDRDRLTWDYVGCGAQLRGRVKEQLCATLGPGPHRFLYQVGDSRKNPSTVLCKK